MSWPSFLRDIIDSIQVEVTEEPRRRGRDCNRKQCPNSCLGMYSTQQASVNPVLQQNKITTAIWSWRGTSTPQKRLYRGDTTLIQV